MPTPICLLLWDTTNKTHQGAFIAILLWVTKVSSFLFAKTSANKRFYTMSAKPIARICSAKVVKNLQSCKFFS